MLAAIKLSKASYLLVAIICSWFEGILYCLMNGLYVAGVLKVRIQIVFIIG